MTEERLDDLALEDVDTLIEIIMAVEAERDRLRFGLAGLLLCVDASEGVKDHVRRALQEAEG